MKNIAVLLLFLVTFCFSNLVFFDPFNQAADPLWVQPEGGDWAVEDAVYHRGLGAYPETDGHYISYAGIPRLADYSVEVDMNVLEDIPGGWGVVCFRIQDGANYYTIQYEPGTSRINFEKRVNYSCSVLASASFPCAKETWYHYNVVVRGDSVYCYVDDVLRLACRDGTFRSGSAGLASWHAHTHFDNFKILSVDSPSYFSIDSNTIALWRFNEMTGDTVHDHSGHGYHGRMLPGVQWADGKYGGAVYADNSSEHIVMPKIQELGSTACYRTEAVVNIPSYSSSVTNPIFCIGKPDVFVINFTIGIHHRRVLGLETYEPGNWFTLEYPLPDSFFGGWMTVGAVYDNGKKELYINHSLVASDSVAPLSFPEIYNTFVGANPWGSSVWYLNGYLDELKISRLTKPVDASSPNYGGFPGVVRIFPNPFYPGTNFNVRIVREGFVSVRIFNADGRFVTSICNGSLAKGCHDFRWKGTNAKGKQMASGLYVVTVRAPGFSENYRILKIQ